MNQHTPGPWTQYVSPSNSWIGHSDTGEIVCDRPNISGGTDRTARWNANARLIAAAPQLLAALKEVKDTIALEQFGLLNVVNNAIELAEGGTKP